MVKIINTLQYSFFEVKTTSPVNNVMPNKLLVTFHLPTAHSLSILFSSSHCSNLKCRYIRYDMQFQYQISGQQFSFILIGTVLRTERKMVHCFPKVSEEEIVAINEAAFFYPSDLVNTKTTSPLRVSEEQRIYTSTLPVSGIIISTTIHLPFRGQLYNIKLKIAFLPNLPQQSMYSTVVLKLRKQKVKILAIKKQPLGP